MSSNESYNYSQRRVNKDNEEWIGGVSNDTKFSKKIAVTNTGYDNNYNAKGWIGQLQKKKTIESQLYPERSPNRQMPMNVNSAQQIKSISTTSRRVPTNTQSPTSKLSNLLLSRASQLSTQRQQKSPMQLMNDIFRSIGIHHLSNSKTYYSRQSEDLLCEILTSKSKMNLYVKKLTTQMSEVPPEVEKNYEILLTLLQQLAEADLEVNQDENGMNIWFNRTELVEKQKEVQRLEKQLEEKNKQTEKIVEEYEAVVRNFNDVIEKLILEKKK